MFSDGEDTSSLVSFDEVLDLAKRSETAIYTIALRGAMTRRRVFERPSSSCARWLGKPAGAPSFRSKIDDLAGVYAQIADELASQYTVGYISQNPKRDGAWRRLAVQDSRPSLTGRTKNGYYAPPVALAPVTASLSRSLPPRLPAVPNRSPCSKGLAALPRIRTAATSSSIDRADWRGERAVLNGPSKWWSVERLRVDDKDWRIRIRSIEVGPTATVTPFYGSQPGRFAAVRPVQPAVTLRRRPQRWCRGQSR